MLRRAAVAAAALSQIAATRPHYAGVMSAKTVALLALPALALLLLGAHWLRSGTTPGVVACVLGLGLLALAPTRGWARGLLQAGLALGAAEWAWTAWLLVQQRQALGQPWLRMALILALVTALTLAGIAALARLPRQPQR
jgi:hypothetical protein